ncbi:MAG TPA: hypothetical protein VLK59_12630, partial [Solirubrobacteraceae bacterium]|nr:hypothetical protein [Solirubrobacteraceae bacterium]
HDAEEHNNARQEREPCPGRRPNRPDWLGGSPTRRVMRAVLHRSEGKDRGIGAVRASECPRHERRAGSPSEMRLLLRGKTSSAARHHAEGKVPGSGCASAISARRVQGRTIAWTCRSWESPMSSSMVNVITNLSPVAAARRA